MKCDHHRLQTSRGHVLLLTLAVFISPSSAQPPVIQFGDWQDRVTKGPCLLRVYADRAALMWETDTPGHWGVSCGTPGQQDHYFASTAEKVAYNTQLIGGARKTAYIHKVWLDGLLPGRTYAYRLVGPDVRGDVYKFRTPSAQTDEVRFIVCGDSRTQPKIDRQLVDQMLKCDVDFVVHTGDLVTRGDDYRLWGPQFFAPLRGLAEKVPIYVAKGNHEGHGGIFEKLLIPPGEENSFEFDCGPLHYFCADNYSHEKEAGRLVGRIIQDARASQATWKFVSYHVPSVNFGGHWSSWQQSDVLPGFAGAGIDFVVTGHSHQYERFRPVAPPLPTGSYVTYITAGGGGAPLANVAPTAFHACARSIYHFCLFHITGDVLTMDAIDSQGHVFDHLEIAKKDGRVDETYTSTAVSAADIQHYQSSRKSSGQKDGTQAEDDDE